MYLCVRVHTCRCVFSICVHNIHRFFSFIVNGFLCDTKTLLYRSFSQWEIVVNCMVLMVLFGCESHQPVKALFFFAFQFLFFVYVVWHASQFLFVYACSSREPKKKKPFTKRLFLNDCELVCVCVSMSRRRYLFFPLKFVHLHKLVGMLYPVFQFFLSHHHHHRHRSVRF